METATHHLASPHWRLNPSSFPVAEKNQKATPAPNPVKVSCLGRALLPELAKVGMMLRDGHWLTGRINKRICHAELAKNLSLLWSVRTPTIGLNSGFINVANKKICHAQPAKNLSMLWSVRTPTIRLNSGFINVANKKICHAQLAKNLSLLWSVRTPTIRLKTYQFLHR